MAEQVADVLPPPSLRDQQRRLVITGARRAAFRLIAERGYDHVTTHDIAEAAGISPRTFFRYFTNKEDLLLGVSRQRGTAILSLLEQQPAHQAADLALSNAILHHAGSFEVTAIEDWRHAISTTPDLLAKVTMLALDDQDRIAAHIAQRMHTDPLTDLRPGLLVHLAFAAGNFAFQKWLHLSELSGHSLHEYVSEALTAVRGRQWRTNR